MKAFPPGVLGLIGFSIFLSVAQADPYRDVILRDKPFAYYRLNDSIPSSSSGSLSRPLGFGGGLTTGGMGRKPEGTPIRDEMKINHGMFVNGPAVGAEGALGRDHENGAISFESAKSQHVLLTKLGNYGKSMSAGFTVEYWLKALDATQYQAVLGTANSSGFDTDFLIDIGYNNEAGRLRMYYRDDEWNRYEANYASAEMSLNLFDQAWHHVVHVYLPKGTTPEERVILYVDGVKQTGRIFRGGEKAPSSRSFNNPMTLGAMNLRGKIQYFLQGSLDEVAFYQVPLAENQVLEHFRASRP